MGNALNPVPHPERSDYWVSAVIFLCFGLFVFIRIYYRKPFEQIFKSLLSGKSGNPALREEFSSSNRVSLFLSILFGLSLSLFIYQALAFFRGVPEPMAGLLLFGKVLLVICIAYLVKSATVRTVAYIFKTSQPAEEYLHTVFIYIRVLGVALLPLVIALAYIPLIPARSLIYTGMGLIMLTFILRTIRAVLQGSQDRTISAFYLFLYLCTLEILPLVVLIKVFMNNKGLFS